MPELPTFEDVQDAARRLEGVAVRTPILRIAPDRSAGDAGASSPAPAFPARRSSAMLAIVCWRLSASIAFSRSSARVTAALKRGRPNGFRM